MTMPASSSLEQFLHSFAECTESRKVPELVAHFADAFLAAGPQGAQCVRSADFAQALPKRHELFERLGCRSTELVSVAEMRLDHRYLLARTKWRMTFAHPDTSTTEVDANSDFVVDTGVNPWKIVFYLANQDLIAVLKQKGITAE